MRVLAAATSCSSPLLTGLASDAEQAHQHDDLSD
jgi:hypothetical protein